MVDGELVINGLQYTVLGIDPLASRFLQPQNTDKLANQNWLQLLSQPNTIFYLQICSTAITVRNRLRVTSQHQPATTNLADCRNT